VGCRVGHPNINIWDTHSGYASIVAVMQAERHRLVDCTSWAPVTRQKPGQSHLLYDTGQSGASSTARTALNKLTDLSLDINVGLVIKYTAIIQAFILFRKRGGLGL